MMEAPEVGFYWAMVPGESDPVIVEYCDEGGDRWFNFYRRADFALDLKDADLALIGRIPAAPEGRTVPPHGSGP